MKRITFSSPVHVITPTELRNRNPSQSRIIVRLIARCIRMLLPRCRTTLMTNGGSQRLQRLVAALPVR